MSVYCITFSPTGGTKAVADILSGAASAEYRSLELCCREETLTLPELTPQDLCIVAVPSFAGRVPGLCTARLRALQGNGAAAVAVVVYGNRAYDDTLSELADTLRRAGFHVPAACTAIAEHSVIRRFAAGRPDESDRAELTAFGQRIAALHQADTLTGEVCVPGNVPAEPRRDGPMAIITTGDCTGCRSCVARCPVEAIDPKQIATDPARCVGCMRCTVVCQRGARVLDTAKAAALDAHLAPLCAEYRHNEFFLCHEA